MVIAFVTTPFEFEGKQRTKNAMLGLDEVREHANSLIVIPNDKLYDMITEDTSLVDAFKKVDLLLMEAVSALTRMILDPGMINLDFADVRSIMSISGHSLLTFGEGMGVHRALNAVDAALSNVLIDSKKLRGAKGLLVNIVGPSDLTLHEVTKCIRKLRSIVHEDANIIFGANVDHEVNEKVMIVIIATGIEDSVDNLEMTKYSDDALSKIMDSHAKVKQDEASSLFESAFHNVEEDFDIPTYIRRNQRYLGSLKDND